MKFQFDAARGTVPWALRFPGCYCPEAQIVGPFVQQDFRNAAAPGSLAVIVVFP
jgi:hypothetical protein